MSGHNKWSTIKHKKAATDAKKGKAFSRISKELMIAAKIGGKDPDANPRLRSALSSARAVNMPNDNVERAIKKGCGELAGQIMEELNYEGYAPGGVAVMVDCLSDNRNRTAADIRNIFTKANASLANTGSVSRLFTRKTRFVVQKDDLTEEKLMELCFDGGVDVEEINVVDGEGEIIATPESFNQLLMVLEKAEITPKESSLVRIAATEIPVTDLVTARQILRLIDHLEEYDDVQSVYSNSKIDDALLEALSNE